MKHPLTREFTMPVHEKLHDKLRSLGNSAYIEHDGAFWATAEVMSKLTGEEYFIVNEDFDPVVRVDFETCMVYCDERGGWSRTYSKSFSELQDLAKKYEVTFDSSVERRAVAEIGYKLIYAENARYHGLGFEQYFPIPKHRFLPPLPTPEIDSRYFTMEQMLDYGEKCRDEDEEEDEG
jgi:hypothetical protein